MPTTIHIIDPSKPSLVMTSEVFKDKIPGSVVTHSSNAKDALAHLALKTGTDAPDVVVVDFDLPDADGVSLIREIRKIFKGPVFLTAFPNDVVKFAVSEELFHYNDSLEWISKPVRSDTLNQKIEQFLVNRFRLGRRFDVDFVTLCIGKGAGRGKRAPKADGRTTNISLGGAGIDFNAPSGFKLGEELVVSLAVPEGIIEGANPLSVLRPIVSPTKAELAKMAAAAKLAAKAQAAKEAAAKASAMKAKAANSKKKGASKSAKDVSQPNPKVQPTIQTPMSFIPPSIKPGTKYAEYKIKGVVAWLGQGGKKVGLTFGKISDQQRRQIETFLKGLAA